MYGSQSASISRRIAVTGRSAPVGELGVPAGDERIGLGRVECGQEAGGPRTCRAGGSGSGRPRSGSSGPAASRCRARLPRSPRSASAHRSAPVRRHRPRASRACARRLPNGGGGAGRKREPKEMFQVRQVPATGSSGGQEAGRRGHPQARPDGHGHRPHRIGAVHAGVGDDRSQSSLRACCRCVRARSRGGYNDQSAARTGPTAEPNRR